MYVCVKLKKVIGNKILFVVIPEQCASKRYTRKKLWLHAKKKKGWNFLKKNFFYAVTFL